jgi:ubiquinone/menaquinone biosynthesis C-methylase UbiE
MKQNIYDIPGFFEGYKRMRDNQSGLNEVLEQPAMLALLPAVKSLNALDLGCGAGDFCRRLSALGARSVIGVDISNNMLELALKEVPPGVSYQNQAMEDVQFPVGVFDLVVSSLAFHYVKDLPDLFRKTAQWLKPQGVLLFSMEHPISTCSQGIHHGWIKDESNHKLFWPVDHYREEGIRKSHWFVAGVIKYHRTISSILNGLIAAGLTVVAVDEPAASAADEELWPELKDARRRPPFLVVKALKPG